MSLFLRLMFWILRPLAWPWAERSVGRWPAAPREITAVTSEPPMTGKAPRAKGARMDLHGHFISGTPAVVGVLYQETPPAMSTHSQNDELRALISRLREPRTLSQFMGPHDMALALVEERQQTADELEALTRGEK